MKSKYLKSVSHKSNFFNTHLLKLFFKYICSNQNIPLPVRLKYAKHLESSHVNWSKKMCINTGRHRGTSQLVGLSRQQFRKLLLNKKFLNIKFK